MASSTHLDLLYETSRRLATFSDLDHLLHFTMEQAREFFDAEGVSVLLLDEKGRHLYFPVISQRSGRDESAERLARTRFPADHGIAGWVLIHDEAVFTEDAQNDPRFFGGVDQQTGVRTSTILCAPMRSGTGNIGVIEVVNPQRPVQPNEDLKFLEALGSDVAIAYEKARLYEGLRGEVLQLRQLCSAIGLALILLSLVAIAAILIGHLAWALPLREMAARPATIASVLALGLGALLAAIGRGWLGTRGPTQPKG